MDIAPETHYENWMKLTHGRISPTNLIFRIAAGRDSAAAHLQATARCSLHALLQGGHVNYKTVFHVALEQALVCFIDLLNLDHLDVRGNSLFPAKLEHLLRFAKPTNTGPGKSPSV